MAEAKVEFVQPKRRRKRTSADKLKSLENFMFDFKTKKCTLPYCPRDFCSEVHKGQFLRRNPKLKRYSPHTKCKQYSPKNGCPQKDQCPCFHTPQERSFHPELYKVKECTRTKCKYEINTKFCTFAHDDEELRNPDKSYEPGVKLLELKAKNLKQLDNMMSPKRSADSMSDVSSRLPQSIGGSSFPRTQTTLYTRYYTMEYVNERHEQGHVIKGTLKVYPNYQVQVIPLEDEPFGTRKITIIGNLLRNRAMQDDIVAVELLYGGRRDFSDTESIRSYASSETGYAEDSDEEELRRSDAGKTVYGKIVAILGGQRRRRYICKSGVYSLFNHLRHHKTGDMDFQCLDSKTGPPKFEVPKDEIFGISPASKYYVIEFVEWGEERRFPKGKFIGVLECNPEIPGQELDKIVGINMLLVELNLELFPEYMKRHEALSAHQSFDFDQGECKERMDLTQGAEQRLVFTIDNETTKDVDDALSLKNLGSEKNGKNQYEVGIHIADVSHYVLEGSQVDKAAETLTSSLYLEVTYNMLPKPLMETCSLLPGKDRLAISVFFVISESGKIIGKPRFEKTVVKSSHKLVYEDVQDFFDQPEGKHNYDHEFPVDLQEALSKLKSLARVLLKKRIERGAVEFRTKTDVDAHQVVQEFMILTNHAVANRLLQFRKEFGGACLLRNQPATKSVAKLSVILRKHFGIENVKSLQDSHVINELYRQIAKQSKKKAAVFKCRMEKMHTSASEYAQNDEKNEHFQMAKPYTHFTSPIRRYVDLCVHRYIKNTMKKKSECPKGIRYMKRFNARARKIKDSRYAWDKIKAFLPLKYQPQQYCGIIAAVDHGHCEVLIEELDRVVKVPYNLLRPDGTEYDELQNRMTLSWKGTDEKVKHVIKMFGDLNVQVTGNLEVFPPELQIQLVGVEKVGWICAYHNNAPDCFGTIEPPRTQGWRFKHALNEYTRKYTRITEMEAAHSSIQENYSETYPNMDVEWSVDYDAELDKNNVLLYAVLPFYKSKKFGPKEGDYVCMRYTEIAARPLVLHGLVEQRYEFRFEVPGGMLDVVVNTPTWTIEIIAKSPSHRVQLKSLLRVRKETGSVMHKLKSEEFKTREDFKFNAEEMHSLCLPQMTRREFFVKLRKTTGRKLNAVQRNACQQALQSRISLIWGPPGTGKTETSAVLIQEIVNYRRGLNKEWIVSGIPDNLKIVMASTSNKSVDNMTEKLKKRGVKVVRVYARYVESVDLKDGYEGITFKSDAHGVPNSIHEIALHRIIRNRKTDLSRKFVEYEQMCKKQKSLSKKNEKKLRNMKQQLEKRNIGQADVICCTAMVAAEQRVLGLFANTVIFDEAAQATEAETVTAICNASHIVLVGDHKQLSPVVNAKGRVKKTIQVSLFEHIHQSSKLNVPCTQLEVQYRMHASISQFPSDAFYDGKLRNEKKQKTERKSDLADGNLPTFSIIPHPQNRVRFYQVMGSQRKRGTTYINKKEAQAVIRCVKALNEKVSLSSISILSPYKGQVDLIKRLLRKQNLSEKIAGTLHSYQGSEHDYVIISWVRSGGKRDLMALKIVQNFGDHETSKRLLGDLLGFVSDNKQLCVAITRAKYGLVHIGNNKLFKYSPVWKKMLDRLQNNGCLSTNRRLVLRKPRPPPVKTKRVSIDKTFGPLLTRSESEIHRNESVSAITSPNTIDTTVGASTPGMGQGPYDFLHHTFPIANEPQLQPPQLHPALGHSKSSRRKRRRRRKTKAEMAENSAPFG